MRKYITKGYKTKSFLKNVRTFKPRKGGIGFKFRSTEKAKYNETRLKNFTIYQVKRVGKKVYVR